VEGIVRNVGMHAGGVLIAPGKITDFCPLYQQPGSDSGGEPVRQGRCRGHRPGQVRLSGPGHADHPGTGQGLHPRRRPERADFAYENIPLNDPKVYKLFSEGLTEAVFQFESRGMQGMLREARPSRLEDLIALNAMFRPGPMENIPSFCARKNGKEDIVYPHALLETGAGARPTASSCIRNR
jgi:DNA polymerase-3 subunit alpha